MLTFLKEVQQSLIMRAGERSGGGKRGCCHILCLTIHSKPSHQVNSLLRITFFLFLLSHFQYSNLKNIDLFLQVGCSKGGVKKFSLRPFPLQVIARSRFQQIAELWSKVCLEVCGEEQTVAHVGSLQASLHVSLPLCHLWPIWCPSGEGLSKTDMKRHLNGVNVKWCKSKWCKGVLGRCASYLHWEGRVSRFSGFSRLSRFSGPSRRSGFWVFSRFSGLSKLSRWSRFRRLKRLPGGVWNWGFNHCDFTLKF